ncbi:MAG: TonB-dependent receptor [Betaproteobacteria bacterium]
MKARVRPGDGVASQRTPRDRARLRALCVAAALLAIADARAQSVHDLVDLSFEELSQIEVTSVLKRAVPLARSPASIYVISSDDIRRSGATNLAEALRLAPNLEVARVDAQSYVISPHGLNSVNASNKLLVLIDGRSIYTPFFSSVFWDQQDVMLADIDRIEVISGPGGALWGSNAMNGVINVITKPAAATQGGLADAELGNRLQHGAMRWGGKLGEAGHYRVYAQGGNEAQTLLAGGDGAHDGWRSTQAGFRADTAALGSTFTVQGDMYENILDAPGGRRSGGNVLGRWERRFADGSTLMVQAYYDQQQRADLAATGSGGSSEHLDTFDVEAEHNFALGRAQQIVWGIGQRGWRDEFINTANPFVLVPQSQTLRLTNIFAQDTIALRDDLELTLGTKFEYSSFSGWAFMPNVRMGWQVSARNFVWGAISRAVRPPSRLERDLSAPGIVDTSPSFQSEKLVAYVAGWRSQLTPQASMSVSLFYNDYSDLRTTSPNPVTILPITFGNGLEGHTYGVDAWGSWSPTRWWRINPGVGLLRKDFHLKPGEADIAGVQTVLGHDPAHQIFLRSYMDLPHDTELYIGLRQIAALPDVAVPAYFEADVRLGWRVSPALELALVGQNLVHARHVEAAGTPIHEIPRSVYLSALWKF